MGTLSRREGKVPRRLPRHEKVVLVEYREGGQEVVPVKTDGKSWTDPEDVVRWRHKVLCQPK